MGDHFKSPLWRPLRNPPAGSRKGGAGRSCLFSRREKIEMRGRLATTTGYRSPPPSRSVTPVTQTSPLGETERGHAPLGARATAQRPPFLPPLPPEAFANSVEGEERRPLALGRGGGAGSYALSRWERVGVRAGGGGGRASLLKPAHRVTQRSPLGETERGHAPLGARAPAQRPPFLPPLPPEAFANSVEGEERRPLALGRGGGAGSYALSRWERVGVRAGGGGGRASLLKPARRVTQRSPLGETERGPLRHRDHRHPVPDLHLRP